MASRSPPANRIAARLAVISPTSATGPRRMPAALRSPVASRSNTAIRERPLLAVRATHSAAEPTAGTIATASIALQTASLRSIWMPHCHFLPTVMRSPATKSTAAPLHDRSGAMPWSRKPSSSRHSLQWEYWLCSTAMRAPSSARRAIVKLRMRAQSGEQTRLGGEAEDAAVIVPEALILRLPTHKANVDLLDDDGELEGSEHLVPKDWVDIEAGAGRVSRDRIGAAREIFAPGRHRSDVAPLWVVAGLDPIIQHITEIGQRVALCAHVPIEHRDDMPGIGRVEQAIVEPVVVVKKRGGAQLRQMPAQPVEHWLHLGGGLFRSLTALGRLPAPRPT